MTDTSSDSVQSIVIDEVLIPLIKCRNVFFMINPKQASVVVGDKSDRKTAKVMKR